MGKQSRSKRPEILGKGPLTPIQVAFLVDRYLFDNRFSGTRSVFRSEATSIIPKSTVCEVPETLLTLDELLNEYIRLKEQKVMVDHEKARLEHEKIRVQSLLQGFEDVMNAFNASASAPSPAIQAADSAATPSTAVVPQPNTFGGSTSGCPVYNISTVMPLSLPFNKRVTCGSFSTPSTSQSLSRKRKGSEFSVGTAKAARKTCNKTSKRTYIPDVDKASETAKCHPEIQSSLNNCATTEAAFQGPSIAKCLFNQAVVSPPANSTCPTTPQQQVSPQSDTSISPTLEVTPPEITATNCTIVSKERITVSPLKQFGCYIVERSHCISSSPAKTNMKMFNKRDHVKGRLNFDDANVIVGPDKPSGDDASTSESEKGTDIFYMDFPNLDLLGENFSFSELLVDLDLGGEGNGHPRLPQTSSVPLETVSGSSPESRDGNLETDQVVSEYSSTVTEAISGKDNSQDSMTAVKSITKCIRILSPVKNCRQ